MILFLSVHQAHALSPVGNCLLIKPTRGKYKEQDKFNRMC